MQQTYPLALEIKEILDSIDDDESKLQSILNRCSVSSVFNGCRLLEANKTTLMYAAKLGRLKCCRYLATTDPFSINFTNRKRKTALHFASYYGHADVTFELLRLGADINIRDYNNESPLESAAAGCNFALVAELQSYMKLGNRYASETIYPSDTSTTGKQQHNSIGIADVSVRSSRDTVAAASSIKVAKRTPQSESEARKYQLHIIQCEPGADESLIGNVFNCLTSDISSNQFNKVLVKQLTIGRSRDNDVHILDLSISKCHAMIVFHNGIGLTLWDRGSKHGTFLTAEDSGEEIPAPHIDTYADIYKYDYNILGSTAILACNNPHTTSNSDNSSIGSAIQIDDAFADGTENTTASIILETCEEKKQPQQQRPGIGNLLHDGSEIRLGRIRFKVIRQRQDAVISKK